MLKKLISLLLALAMVISMAACGAPAEPTVPATEPAQTQTQDTTPTEPIVTEPIAAYTQAPYITDVMGIPVPVEERLLSVDELIEAMENGTLPKEEIRPFVVEIPQDLKNGDYSTNVAMVNSKVFRSNPRAIATAIMKYMEFDGTFFERAELAGPGFINFFLNKFCKGLNTWNHCCFCSVFFFTFTF